MCGIVGYIGNKNGADVVFQGLKLLEYRGYDSWGIALKNESRIDLFKKTGKIGDFDLKKQLPGFSGQIAIGHTRWATHGGVTEVNAHPHLGREKRIAVVHNGIIENYQEMRRDLEAKGIRFQSETDTEVIPHAIELELNMGKSITEAIRAVLKMLEGSYALAVIDREQNTLIGAREGSPLVFGIGKDEYFIASDVPAFLKYSKKVVFLDDLEMVVADSQGYKIFDVETGQEVSKKTTQIAWSFEEAEKGGYPHFMAKEMNEQPLVIEKTIATATADLEKAVLMMKKAKNIYVIACGTAYHAGVYGSYIFAKVNGINLRPISAAEFPYFSQFVGKGDLVIAVSQSGETADVLDAVKSAQAGGAKILALVNVMGSTLMRVADFSIITKAGPEICVLSTKAYVSQLAMFVMLSSLLNGKPSEGKKILRSLKINIENILESKNLAKVKKLAKELASRSDIYAIGRGINYPTSLEACLKIKEVSYIHAEGYAGGDLKHGPIALIEKDVPVLVFVAKDGSEKEIVSNAMEVKSRGAEVIGISFENNSIFDVYLPVADNGIYSGISAILYGQLLAYYIALEKNLDPDKPRNLAKSVTVK
ncbi:MAG: glutamine--fructose-6-phosphate transaminase (isomerizing) [Patescibacteria group bacterium]